MIKQTLFAILMTLLAGGICLEPVADAAECSAGWGKKVTKLAGLNWYPAACRSTVCHVATHEASYTEFVAFPPSAVLYFHYRANASSGTGLPACPADVNAAQFRKP